MLAALALTSLALQQPLTAQRSGAARSPTPAAAANTRRAALLAGGTAAAVAMLPAAAFADAIADIAARNNAQAAYEKENKEALEAERDNKQIIALLASISTCSSNPRQGSTLGQSATHAFGPYIGAVAAVVFAGPITGIKGAEKAIDTFSQTRGDDDALKANLKQAQKPTRPAGKLPWER